MADYSQSPLDLLRKSREQGYVGIHLEQGVPILDRDLNLLHDLVAATAREVFTRYIGNGNASGDDGFAVQALPADDGQNSQNFTVTAGACLVDGIECANPKAITYKSQGLVGLTTPPTEERTDCVYLDVTLEEVDGSSDPDLLNSHDIGIQTSVRIKPKLVVRVSEGSDKAPEPGEGHSHYPLALLRRPAGHDSIEQSAITDQRQHRLTVAAMENRLSLMERILLIPEFAGGDNPQFTPMSAGIGQGITLNGAKFDRGTIEVFFGDARAIVETQKPNEIVAKVPAGLTPDGVAEKVLISVRNEVGLAVSSTQFTVKPTPAFAAPGSQFTVHFGALPSTQVDIHGFNLITGGTPQVTFVDVTHNKEFAATEVTPTSNTLIHATVPEGLVPAGSPSSQVKITVKTTVGDVTSDDSFTALPPVLV